MEEILRRYNRKEISEICDVHYNTAANWVKEDNMPVWAIKKLGFRIVLQNDSSIKLEQIRNILK
jgi:predicted site-specific integrase-resolvase